MSGDAHRSSDQSELSGSEPSRKDRSPIVKYGFDGYYRRYPDKYKEIHPEDSSMHTPSEGLPRQQEQNKQTDKKNWHNAIKGYIQDNIASFKKIADCIKFTKHVLENPDEFWIDRLGVLRVKFLGGINTSDEEATDNNRAESSTANSSRKRRRIDNPVHTIEPHHDSSIQDQLKRELDSYSNINALRGIKDKTRSNIRHLKEGPYKNDLGYFLGNIETIIKYHRNEVDDDEGTAALQRIKNIVNENPNTRKYYTEIQNIARAPEQAVSQDQLKRELDSYSNINALRVVKIKTSNNLSRLKEGPHKNSLKDFTSNIETIIKYHQSKVNDDEGTAALQRIKDIVNKNPNTRKHYEEIQNIARAPEQAISQDQLKRELDSYSNINALRVIRDKTHRNHRDLKEGPYKNDLGYFLGNIETIIKYHQNEVDDDEGTAALQHIKNIVNENPNTRKYYTEIQDIARAPEQAVSQDQLKRELDSYSNINALRGIRDKIHRNHRQLKEGSHKNDLGYFLDNIETIIQYHQNEVDDDKGTTALQDIKDIVTANPQTGKYYTEIQNIASETNLEDT